MIGCVLIMNIYPVIFILSLAVTSFGHNHHNRHCKKHLNALNFSVQDAYCEQPFFVTFLQKTQENLLLDNVCHTLFPLPDDPETFQLYISKVYCDGSTEIISFVTTQMAVGVTKSGSPYCTFTDTVFGYAGCDTYLLYRCFEFGDCGSVDGTLVFGLSSQPYTIGISCLRKVEEIVDAARIHAREYYVLPMKLPNRCVTQQLCLAPSNPFYNHLPGHRRTVAHV